MGCTTPAHRFSGWIPFFALALAACQPAADFPDGAPAELPADPEAAAPEGETAETAVPVANMTTPEQQAPVSPAPGVAHPDSQAEPPGEAPAERAALPDVAAGAAVAAAPGGSGAPSGGAPPDRVAQGTSEARTGADPATTGSDPARSAAAPPAGAAASGAAVPPRATVPPPAVPPSVEAPAPTGDCRVPQPPARAGTRRLSVFFTCGEEERAVVRVVDGSPAVLRAVLEALLRGPTNQERAAGYHSFFSDATAGMLRGVAVSNGVARVDFRDFSSIIPNASSSAGSAQLIEQLRATIFQFPTVRAAEIMFDGSCDRFWTWLQRGCQQLHR
jgi:Sporulation and spore germination